MSRNKANEALMALDRLSVKIASRRRNFDNYGSLTTEDLVKLALQKFLEGRNSDSIISGIKNKVGDGSTVLAKSACCILEGKDFSEDQELVAELTKRARFKILGAIGKYLIPAGLGAATGYFTGRNRGREQGSVDQTMNMLGGTRLSNDPNMMLRLMQQSGRAPTPEMWKYFGRGMSQRGVGNQQLWQMLTQRMGNPDDVTYSQLMKMIPQGGAGAGRQFSGSQNSGYGLNSSIGPNNTLNIRVPRNIWADAQQHRN